MKIYFFLSFVLLAKGQDYIGKDCRKPIAPKNHVAVLSKCQGTKNCLFLNCIRQVGNLDTNWSFKATWNANEFPVRYFIKTKRTEIGNFLTI